MKKYLFSSILLGLISLCFRSSAQTDQELLSQVVKEEWSSVEALVLYPEETRVAILEAAQYPEALIKIGRVQSATSESFRNLLEEYPREIQEVVWDLTRYPELLEKLVAGGIKTAAEIEEATRDYPSEIKEEAMEAGLNHYQLLVRINDLSKSAHQAFETLIKDYPPDARESFRKLLDLPEVLSILTEDIQLTILAGEVYRKNPEWVLRKVDSLNLVVSQQNEKELEDWKQSLDENPEAREDLKETTEAFTQEYGYDDLYYEGGADDLYYDDDAEMPVEKKVVEHHYYHHYPYWFGYPGWYSFPRWRPYPWWWDCGFYFGPNRQIIVINLPSFYYTEWYFYHPYHHYRYPHLSAHFTNYYYGHRGIGTSIGGSVERWRDRNRDIVDDNWLRDKERLVERFREFGKFEEARARNNRERPDRQLSQQEFLEKNKRRYPQLDREAQVERPQTRQPVEEPRKRTDVKKPQAPKPEVEPTPRLPRQRQPAEKPQRQPDQPDRVRTPRPIPKVENAKSHHQNKWEQSGTNRSNTAKPSPKTTEPKQSPRERRKDN